MATTVKNVPNLDPFAAIQHFSRIQQSDWIKLLISVIEPFDVCDDATLEVGSCVSLLKTVKSGLSAVKAPEKGIDAYKKFWDFERSCEGYFDSKSVVSGGDVFRKGRAFGGSACNFAAKGCETVKLLDKFDIIEVPNIRLVSALKSLFTAIFLGNNVCNNMGNLFGDLDGFKTQIARDPHPLVGRNRVVDLPAEIEDSYVFAEQWNLVRNSSGLIVNTGAVVGYMLGFTLSAQFLFALGIVWMVSLLAEYYFKFHAESYKGEAIRQLQYKTLS